MNLRAALITQSPSLALQRSAADEIARLDAQLSQILAEQAEPFGYFRALPFGWEGCSKDDDGAVALYERQQAPLKNSAQAVIDAWDSAPGVEVYRFGPLMDWLTKTMLPAISKLRESMRGGV